MNFYSWVREGVKRAVLLGFSDALEHIGVPHETEDAREHLLAIVRQGKATELTERAAAPSSGRKRLGRSLDEIVKNPSSGTP